MGRAAGSDDGGLNHEVASGATPELSAEHVNLLFHGQCARHA
jgi:hypothetical protein